MWYTWSLLVVCCTLVKAEAEVTVAPAEVTVPPAEAVSVATTTRGPPRTLDRQAAELAWKTWLQSPENGNPNAPPRRITTKSLFITPYVCPKGQRLDRNGCVQVVTVNKDEHERILLEQLNALFTSAPSGDLYDYGDDEPGPLQLSIPIGLDPQAAPLQGQEPSAQAQELQPNYVKKDDNKQDMGTSIEAELEILKLQNDNNNTAPGKGVQELINDLTILNSHLDKPKRDNAAVNDTETASINSASEDEGQKELVFGHVNVDPVLYNVNNEEDNTDNTGAETQQTDSSLETKTPVAASDIITDEGIKTTNDKGDENAPHHSETLKKDGDKTKLNPENDYSDIGEAIKLISRYAEVTTDDNFSKDQKKYATKDEGILGTRTKLQHRRNKPKLPDAMEAATVQDPTDLGDKMAPHNSYLKNAIYFRYPWPAQHSATPPPDYPFRHLQDYWAGHTKFGGVYNNHENPRRHHHSFPHNFRPHGYPYGGLPGPRDAYPEQLKGYIHRVMQHHVQPHNNQDLYSLLGLRHWFSSEGASKR